MANKSWKFADSSSILFEEAELWECCWSVNKKGGEGARHRWDCSRGRSREKERLQRDLRHLGEKEDNGGDWKRNRVTGSKRGLQGFDGADWLFSVLLRSATVRSWFKYNLLHYDGDRLGSPWFIDSQAHSFVRIRIDVTCLKPRFIYLFIWCLLWASPHLS